VAGPGRDASVVLNDGRVLEYWDGGDPAGRPMVYHPGTPVTRVLGRWAHDAAREAGVRLVAINRPGYEGSSPAPGTPSLLGVGRDTVGLARRLHLGDFAAVGTSGGGPYATATAIAAGGAVRALGIVGGVGPWPIIDEASANPEDRACLALLETGDVDGARACFHRQVQDERGRRSPREFFEAIVADDRSAVLGDARYRSLWELCSEQVLANPAGYVDDNIAWGGAWDIQPQEVVTRTLLWYGTEDTRCSHDGHGRWYADRIPGAELVVLAGAAHFDVIDGHWPEVFEGLLRIWPDRDG
jgi:pimeloyl-ACP methyl ester carboxylesterase